MPPPPFRVSATARVIRFMWKTDAGLGYGALQSALSTFQSAGAQTPGMTFPVSSYQANVPQLEVKVDRLKAKAQGVALADVFETPADLSWFGLYQ